MSQPSDKKVTNMKDFVTKSHSLVKKITNMKVFVIKSDNLVKKSHENVNFYYKKS